MATSNKAMSDMLRGGRDSLNAYMYGAEGPADESEDVEETPAEGLTLRKPGEEDDPALYTYARGLDGAWMLYPPGVPCDSGEYRVQSDHPASAEEMDRMATMLDEAQPVEEPTDSAEDELGIEE